MYICTCIHIGRRVWGAHVCFICAYNILLKGLTQHCVWHLCWCGLYIFSLGNSVHVDTLYMLSSISINYVSGMCVCVGVLERRSVPTEVGAGRW